VFRGVQASGLRSGALGACSTGYRRATKTARRRLAAHQLTRTCTRQPGPQVAARSVPPSLRQGPRCWGNGKHTGPRLLAWLPSGASMGGGPQLRRQVNQEFDDLRHCEWGSGQQGQGPTVSRHPPPAVAGRRPMNRVHEGARSSGSGLCQHRNGHGSAAPGKLSAGRTITTAPARYGQRSTFGWGKIRQRGSGLRQRRVPRRTLAGRPAGKSVVYWPSTQDTGYRGPRVYSSRDSRPSW